MHIYNCLARLFPSAHPPLCQACLHMRHEAAFIYKAESVIPEEKNKTGQKLMRLMRRSYSTGWERIVSN